MMSEVMIVSKFMKYGSYPIHHHEICESMHNIVGSRKAQLLKMPGTMFSDVIHCGNARTGTRDWTECGPFVVQHSTLNYHSQHCGFR